MGEWACAYSWTIQVIDFEQSVHDKVKQALVGSLALGHRYLRCLICQNPWFSITTLLYVPLFPILIYEIFL